MVIEEQTQLRILLLAKGRGGKVLCPWNKLWERCKRQSLVASQASTNSAWSVRLGKTKDLGMYSLG